MDDNDDPTRPHEPTPAEHLSSSPSGAASDNGNGDDDAAAAAEDALEDEAQDFRLFATLFHKKRFSAQTIRKGTKDFEAHGTRAQDSALEQSRAAMEEALSYMRTHRAKDWVRGWYFPDWWAEWEDGDGEWDVFRGCAVGEEEVGKAEDKKEKVKGRWPEFARHRVVLVESSLPAAKNVGRAMQNQGKDRPAKGMDWLLPEEALFLVERGSLDLWWPFRGLEEMFPSLNGEQTSEAQTTGVLGHAEEFDLGVPLSLEAAYSLLIGDDEERGKVSLRKFQVYANLKRSGYNVCRAPTIRKPLATPTPQEPLWKWLFSFLASERTPRPAPYGPLITPGLYRAYRPIYQRLAVISRHKPSSSPSSPWAPSAPFQIHFCVWRSSTPFSKTRPSPPDFCMAVVDAQESAVPTLEQIVALLDDTPYSPPKAAWGGPGYLYPRLKNGHRNVLVAVNDHGVINYMRFSEGSFAHEDLFARYDKNTGPPRGGKNGGRGGGRGGRGGGRGGRGGRGRGRGRR